ncbi:MAG: aquaporin, partial [Bifidobacterium ruminantium]|nr:aquaporin [Bifidobacterium ruminantium]
NYFLNEFFGTFMLVLGALCCLSLPWGKADLAASSIVVGFIVWGLVTSMGGPTGPGLNPARDLMPRLLHAILPIPNKGSSRWGEAWIPVVAPILGAIVGAFLFKVLFA